MINIRFDALASYIHDVLVKLGMSEENTRIMTDIYISTTKRGVGHHDIYNFPSRLERFKENVLNINPSFEKLSGFGGIERWDGDNGPGELINHFSMQRAIDLACEHGIGMCTMRNSNHYLCSAPFVEQAARQGCIGFIIAKGIPTMGMPGIHGKLIGQSPIGFAFPVGNTDPVMLDICLAYVSGEQLMHMAMNDIPVPSWWGVNEKGEPTTDAKELMRGTKHPIGEHKGFGLAILCELLTGVLSGGLILDDKETEPGIPAKSTSHTAFAIKVDALMPMAEYEARSQELVDRIRARADEIHIPGDASWEKIRAFEACGGIALKEELVEKLNLFASDLGVEFLKSD